MVRCTDCRCEAHLEVIEDIPSSFRVVCPACWKSTPYRTSREEAIREWYGNENN